MQRTHVVSEDNYWLTSYYLNCSTVSNLDDSSLVEECMHITNTEDPNVDYIYNSYMSTGEITPDDRLYLEYYYVLYYTPSVNRKEQ
jgi:hypothetical protein